MISYLDTESKEILLKHNEAIENTLLDICKPLLEYNIKIFGYEKITFDMEYTMICSNSKFLELLLDKCDFHPFPPRDLKRFLKDPRDYVYWRNNEAEAGKDLSEVLKVFNLSNGVSFFFNHNPIEIAFFCSEEKDIDFIDFCINNLDIVKNFISYFKSHYFLLKNRGLENKIFLKRNNFVEFSRSPTVSIMDKDGNYISLSSQESQLMSLLSTGKTAKEIAKAMHISHRTVESYLENIKKKTGYFWKSELIKAFHSSKIRTKKKKLFLKKINDETHKIRNHFHLTKREIECLSYLLRGKTFKEIALTLKLSPRTVECHINNIKEKVGAHTKSELIKILSENSYHKPLVA